MDGAEDALRSSVARMLTVDKGVDHPTYCKNISVLESKCAIVIPFRQIGGDSSTSTLALALDRRGTASVCNPIPRVGVQCVIYSFKSSL